LNHKPIPFLVRPVKKTDLPSLSLIYRTCFSSEFFPEKWSLSSASQRVSQMFRSTDHHGWTAVAYDHPIGFAFLRVKVGSKGNYGEVLEMAVHPFFQKQGIGKALVDQVRKFKKKHRLTTVYTMTFQGPTEGFYKKLGFKPSRRSRVWSIHR